MYLPDQSPRPMMHEPHLVVHQNDIFFDNRGNISIESSQHLRLRQPLPNQQKKSQNTS